MFRAMGAPVARAVHVAVLLAVAGALLAGCSKDDAPTTTFGPSATTAPLTKEDFVKQANQICADADKEITAIASTAPINNGSNTNTQDSLKAVVVQITPIAQGAITGLKNLTPPAADAAKVTNGIAQMQATLAAAQQDPSNRLDPIGIPDTELANYGITNCFTHSN